MVVEPGGARPRPGAHGGLLLGVAALPGARLADRVLARARCCSLLAVTVTPIETIALNYLLSVHLSRTSSSPSGRRSSSRSRSRRPSPRRAPRVPPLLALALWVVNYGVWHLPWIYDAALRHPHSLLHLEHALYFLTGVVLWWPVVHGDLSAGAKAAYLFAAFALASPIGLMMALVPEPIYDFYVEAPEAVGAVPAPRPADRRRLDGGGGGSRLLRGLCLLLRALLRGAGRGGLRPNRHGHGRAPQMVRLPVRHRLGAGIEPGPRRRAGSDRRTGDDRRSSLGEPRTAAEERRDGSERRTGTDRRNGS